MTKTPIGLGLFDEARKQNPSLFGIFIVKASLKSQWLDEVAKFTDYRATVISTYKAATRKFGTKIRKIQKETDALVEESATDNAEKITELKQQVSDLEKEREETFSSLFDTNTYDIFIVNYETLLDEHVKEILHELDPQFWYIDEIDAIKNNASQRAQAVYEFNQAEYRFGATATPIRKNPKDLFGIFSFIEPKLFPSETLFNRTYLRFWYGRVSGSQNEEQLAQKVAPYIFKRTFEEIADQLPKQGVYQVYCPMTDKQLRMNQKLSLEIAEFKEQAEAMYSQFTPTQLAQNKEYQRLNTAIQARQTYMQELGDSEELFDFSESKGANRYSTGSKSNKIEVCMAIVEKIIGSGEKVCIFSKYIHMQDILEREIRERFSDVDIDRIIGATSDDERHKILDRYNHQDSHKVLLLSDSGEAGLNLSSTKYMIEFELADSAAKQTQRHGRIQRADSIHKNVFVYQLISRGTPEYPSWDEISLHIVNKKQGYADRIL